ncbi:Hypothetical predicted protein, partial [Paramuricea clavata]
MENLPGDVVQLGVICPHLMASSVGPGISNFNSVSIPIDAQAGVQRFFNSARKTELKTELNMEALVTIHCLIASATMEFLCADNSKDRENAVRKNNNAENAKIAQSNIEIWFKSYLYHRRQQIILGSIEK